MEISTALLHSIQHSLIQRLIGVGVLMPMDRTQHSAKALRLGGCGESNSLERSTNPWASPPFTLLVQNLPGQPGTTTFTDTNAASLAPLFYRVGVGP